MRIISGNLKKKKLHTVRGMETRPTADRVRESIFNILLQRVKKAVVLDLYAGTGALGIECLSRGAQSAVFIDIAKEALSVIKKNIQSCAVENQSKIVKWNILNNLNSIKEHTPPFDLVFMDPPYDRDTIGKTLHNLHESRSLARGATIIVEHSDKEQISDETAGYRISDRRKYGKTVVSFLEYVI